MSSIELRPLPLVSLVIPLAALVAGIVMAGQWLAFMLLAWLIDGQPGAVELQAAIGAGVIGAVCFAVGLIFPGSVIWMWLHGVRQRSYRSAILATSLGAYAATVLISAFAGWAAFLFGLWSVLPGAAAGMAIRALAYRVRPLPAPPA